MKTNKKMSTQIINEGGLPPSTNKNPTQKSTAAKKQKFRNNFCLEICFFEKKNLNVFVVEEMCTKSVRTH